MCYYCISDDADVLAGMRLCGICGVLVSGEREVAAAVAKAESDPNVAVLLVTESCYKLCEAKLNELKLSAERPLVNIIPHSHESTIPPDRITRLITEAIGIKI